MRACFLLLILFLTGCEKDNQINLDDLNSRKQDFIEAVFDGEVDEGPFFLNYKMKTIFFSKDVVSIFEEFSRYTNLPHESVRYEGKIFCKINGKLKQIYFDDLFPTESDKEFIRKHCEDVMIAGSIGYFGEDSSFRESLNLDDVKNVVIDEQFLIIIFQRYVVAGLDDLPTVLKIPHHVFKSRLNSNNPLISLLEKTIESKLFVSSWE